MRFGFSDEQDELRRSVRRVLDAAGGPAAARRTIDAAGRSAVPARRSVDAAGRSAVPASRSADAAGPADDAAGVAGYDAALWAKLARELGLAGIAIPEMYGGAGLGWVELVAVMEELGRGLAPVPFLSSAALATAAILAAADPAQQQALLPPLARGDVTATVAWLEVGGDPDPAAIGATARPAADGEHVLIDGRKRFVLDGDSADLLLVVARTPGSRGRDGLAIYAVPAGAAGVRRQRLPTMDQTRALAEIVLTEVRLPASARLGRGGWAAIERALALGRIALAAEQVGGAQRCLELSVEYAKVRQQFGRPIGSFQAVQHTLADMFVRVESARSAAYYAAWAAATETETETETEPAAHGGLDDLVATAAIAAVTCGDAFFDCAADTIQVHGGIGFTWEHDAHLYFKRARAGRHLLGAPAAHRDAVARRLGLGGAP